MTDVGAIARQAHELVARFHFEQAHGALHPKRCRLACGQRVAGAPQQFHELAGCALWLLVVLMDVKRYSRAAIDVLGS